MSRGCRVTVALRVELNLTWSYCWEKANQPIVLFFLISDTFLRLRDNGTVSLTFYVRQHNWITLQLTKESFLPRENYAPSILIKRKKLPRCYLWTSQRRKEKKKNRFRLVFENLCYFVSETPLKFFNCSLITLWIWTEGYLMKARWFSTQPNIIGRNK